MEERPFEGRTCAGYGGFEKRQVTDAVRPTVASDLIRVLDRPLLQELGSRRATVRTGKQTRTYRRQNNRPPDKVFLVMAAPAGRSMIPITALGELAAANGMSLYQLAGSSPTGDVVLPEFLPAGNWDLYLARRGEPKFRYEKVGSVRTPLTRSVVIAAGP